MKKLLMIFTLSMFLVLAACGNGDDVAHVEYPVEYFNANVTGSTTDGETLILTIDGEGFYPMTAEVSFEGGAMVGFEITNHSESAEWGGVIIDRGDIQSALIDKWDDLDSFDVAGYSDVDADTGATATAEALEDIAVAAVEHYLEYYAD